MWIKNYHIPQVTFTTNAINEYMIKKGTVNKRKA